MGHRLFEFFIITDEELKTVFNNINVLSYKLIKSGMSTTNYEVYTDTGKYLLKIYPVENNHYEIERAAYNFSSKIIDVPKIILSDSTKTILDTDYMILEFINGISLRDYIVKNNGVNEELIYNIARSTAMLHKREYSAPGLLDKDLNLCKSNNSILPRFENLINGIAGNHIGIGNKECLLELIYKNSEFISKIDNYYGFVHGDLSFSNILIDADKNPWFIDFEYCMSDSIYCDIGKFFRSRGKIDEYITEEVKEAFKEGYNSISEIKLDDEWYRLGKVYDMLGLLILINRESVPASWVSDIIAEIINLKNNVLK